MINITKINIKIFLDTANLKIIKNSLKNYPFIKGFTTNPSLMHKKIIKNLQKKLWKTLRIYQYHSKFFLMI